MLYKFALYGHHKLRKIYSAVYDCTTDAAGIGLHFNNKLKAIKITTVRQEQMYSFAFGKKRPNRVRDVYP